MSKTAQRKRSTYDQGFEHGRTGHYFMWKRHPYIGEYKRGYKAGLKCIRRVKSYTFWQALAYVFGWRKSL